ncbi:uncharacterized protein LOC129583381 [Paramacrobiotus metropolitanus]|uniref:uncharacterized protein LOC129583381 n=1 Tax=Paramacrobiotus metropolitanus TaxID=2943436 RepID=UPI0024462CA5|nr:uncharacterized protein LOC129583381 [Paramacrobiotus metropolitanus]
MEDDLPSNSDGLTSNNKSLSLVPASPLPDAVDAAAYNTTATTTVPATPVSLIDTNTTLPLTGTDDTSTIHWTYSVLGRRLLFRPFYKPEYKDAEDYYQKSYDPLTGVRVAVALGGLMLFICGIAVYNRYGFFRKRRRLHVSLRNSQEQLEGIEWLKVIGFHETSLAYNPVCSDQDLPKSPPCSASTAADVVIHSAAPQQQPQHSCWQPERDGNTTGPVKDRLIVENEHADARWPRSEQRTFNALPVVSNFPKRTKTINYKQTLPLLRRTNSF